MEKRTMHIFGDNVKDREGLLGSKLTGGSSLTTEYLTIPKTSGLRIIDHDTFYCKMKIDNSKMIHLDNDFIRIPVDEKYDMDGIMMPMDNEKLVDWMNKENITAFLDISLAGNAINGGGGAHNSAYGSQVYLNSNKNLPLEIRLVVPYTSSLIANNLPLGLQYDAIIGSDDNQVPSNLNISLEYGKKLTFRSTINNNLTYNIDSSKIRFNDIIAIDSIKDINYINAISNIIDSRHDVELYLAATDSMIKKLGRDKVYELALKSDLYVSNSDEFSLLMKQDLKDVKTLADVLVSFQDEHRHYSGNPGTIAITLGERGSVICDKKNKVYFQTVATPSDLTTNPFAKNAPIVNTNGCGDAYFAMMGVGHANGYGSIMKLNYANAAGHLCAFESSATAPTLFTDTDIENYRTQFTNAPITLYNINAKKFEPTGF